MDAIFARIRVLDAVQIRFYFMDKVFKGNVAAVHIELRGPDGDLYTPNRPNPAVGVFIYQVDSDGNLGANPVVEVSAAQLVLDANFPVEGNFRAIIDTSNLAVGRYIMRAISPYGSGDVLAQADFWVQDPSVVPV